MADTTNECDHLVTPASKMHDVLIGSKSRVKALCGAFVKSAPSAENHVCRDCVAELLRIDEEKAQKDGVKQGAA